jgi:fumarylpyruvate hydrolase
MSQYPPHPTLPAAQAEVLLPIAGHSNMFPVGRVYCIGRNYPWMPEDKTSPKAEPSWFMKPNTAVMFAQGVLPYPCLTKDFCHEVELVVAVGKDGTNIDPLLVEREYVWGYAVGLDLTRRDLQKIAKQTGGPWESAKAFDFSAPCSAIVPINACAHPKENAIWLDVNGQKRQNDSIANLLFPVSELVAMLSRSVTLRAGDLIFTGTPFGVDVLNPQDVIHAGVEGLGEILMRVGEPTCGHQSQFIH